MLRMLRIALVLSASTIAAGVAWSMPAVPLTGTTNTPDITPVAGGCGPYRHRGFFGYCRLNLVRPYGAYGTNRPFRFYRPFIFIRRPFLFRP